MKKPKYDKEDYPKTRGWFFTLNNWTEMDKKNLTALKCQYILFGEEGKECGTPHLQGMVYFNNTKEFTFVKKRLGDRAHIEAAKSLKASITYCLKGQQSHEEYEKFKTKGPNYGRNATITELGVRPRSREEVGAMEKDRWRNIRISAELGKFDNIDDQTRVVHYRTLKCIHNDSKASRKLPDTEFKSFWFWGATRTGKSRWVRDRFDSSDIYRKKVNKWWDGYKDEPIVIVEDVSGRHNTDAFMDEVKDWTDRYEFPAETKGGGGKIRPKVFIFTSNWSIDQVFPCDDEDRRAIKERFIEIEFKKGETPLVMFPSKTDLGIEEIKLNNIMIDEEEEEEKAVYISDGESYMDASLDDLEFPEYEDEEYIIN